ncbi:hypothetical protein [Levilactobacillus tujiorum]|uniref:Uncharacterized protein n=1 Tax=Levilactobacillus tujiorum TaxID=2912243 RepID=A0ABX1L484_9LACO|nr:hypothetical protein [Levilactobacillus tujiorum]MCH5464800.1 hypothetical protein [Levilactobacillus tujiorum]NLR11902.1 hypothetical protein [Lactobacillus sp. HBUAS51387]NLR29836.1 hypothetical protein [Levilactobacillus tujiorum]
MHKFSKLSIGLIAFLTTLFVGTRPISAQTEKPSALVKVGNFTASTDFLNLSQYFEVTRTIKIKVNYVPTHKVAHAISRDFTLPAGTIVAGNLTSTKSGDFLVPTLQLYLARLSYPLIHQNAPAGYTIDPGAGAYDPQATLKATDKLTAFKRISAPKFMPAYSHGDLYLGGAKAALSAEETTTASIRVTPDGYVEYLTYDTKANAGLGFMQKPTGMAKITKTDFHDPYRKLYFSQKIKGLTTKRVSHSGPYQYQLTLKNLHDPQHNAGNEDNGIAGTFDSLYRISGQTYFTFIGYDGVSG